jgi:hypothetical protein
MNEEAKKAKARDYNSKYYNTNRKNILKVKKEQREEKTLVERQEELKLWKENIMKKLNPFCPFDYRLKPEYEEGSVPHAQTSSLDKTTHKKEEL